VVLSVCLILFVIKVESWVETYGMAVFLLHIFHSASLDIHRIFRVDHRLCQFYFPQRNSLLCTKVKATTSRKVCRCVIFYCSKYSDSFSHSCQKVIHVYHTEFTLWIFSWQAWYVWFWCVSGLDLIYMHKFMYRPSLQNK